MPQCDDSQRSRDRMNSKRICKRSGELKDGGMPQCRIVTNMRHGISPNKTLWDMLNDDAMKRIYIASMNKR